jgi:hypothetical protein
VKSPALLVTLLLVLAPRAFGAEPLTTEQVARVRVDEAIALARVDAAHGHRLPSQMSSEERRQVIAEQARASSEALARNGVDAKTYARRSARLSRAEVAEVEAQVQQLQEEAMRPQSHAPPPEGIQVEYGTPVSVEPAPERPTGDEVPVDYGTPVPLPDEALPAGE